ncbi:MAG TPA: tetratricopeptide repeat protein [Syntrophobacteraceae bacterium]|nr:tetratricopeptide repeat protein [Syntrophobacteraceae bacterium]
MNLSKLLQPGKVSEETFQILTPVFEGEVLCKQERYLEAEAKYLEALKDFPSGSGGRFLIYNKLGIVYEKMEQFEQAIAVYEKGAKEGSTTPFCYQDLACLCMDAGRLREAMRYCDQGRKCLKRARTTFFQEIYFWLIFFRIERKIKRLLSDSGSDGARRQQS